jgi:hypothetical protein
VVFKFKCGHFLFIISKIVKPIGKVLKTKNKKTLWPESASELHRLSDYRLSAKLVPTFAGRRRCVVSATDPHGRSHDLLGRSRYFFFEVAPQLHSRG